MSDTRAALATSLEPLSLVPSERTLQRLLTAQAERLPSEPCLVVDDWTITFSQALDVAATVAGVFAEAGISPGDRVAIVSDSRADVMRCLLGCIWSGAVLVPINTASRGPQLEHLLANAGPRVVVGDCDLLPFLAGLPRPPEVEQVWHIGHNHGVAWGGIASVPMPTTATPHQAASVRPGDPLAILYTSGTTGPSKGVVCPHGQFYWWAATVGEMLQLGHGDTAYTCLPLFHTNALNAFAQSVMHGARFVVGPRFSASRFWRRLAAADATVTYLLGTMIAILAATKPTRYDRNHRVRVALAPGTPAPLWAEFSSRFGVDLVDAYGMTETNAVIGPRDGEQRPGWMGRVMPRFEACIVDEFDCPVPDGTPGELVMRATEPYAFSAGYWRMPDETVSAWRNLWFHSGDRAIADDGWFRFIDRMKDAIRRRGENISAWEVEQVLLQHPAVEAVAVIPVPSEIGEDDVMACIVPTSGSTLDLAQLVDYCASQMAYFAIPRYVDIMDELPLTENGKVRKNVLRERGITATTWDREGGPR